MSLQESVRNPAGKHGRQSSALTVMSQLPIEEIKSEFHTHLPRYPLVVEAPPGSGKSTQLPLWCGEKGRVLVVEPRRLACRSLASFTARSLGQEVGEEVGYSIRFAQHISSNTRIVFATPGIALRWYASDGFAGFDTVILDEFHERRWDTDLLAALLRGSNKQIVLASATVEGQRLARYLAGKRLQARGKLYEVEVNYRERDSLPRTKDLDKRVADAVVQALDYAQGGDVLVFLPGKGEIRDAQARLEKKRIKAEVIPLHASVDTQIQDRALQPGDGSRIILATNVAETSLTLPGVRAVVDSGLQRRTHYRNGRTVLALTAISRAAAEQRAGRAGRLGPGVCFRLWGRAARLEPYTPPEVVREDPSEFILSAAACGHRIENVSCPDPIPEHSLEKARYRLQAIGALDGQGCITEHGRRLFHLPLDAQLAHLIAAAEEGTKADLVDLAAALTAQGPILLPQQGEKGSAELAEFAPEACDACTLIRLLRKDPPRAVSLNHSALAEARRISAQIRQVLQMESLQASAVPQRDSLVLQILRADPELAFVRRIKRDWSMGNGSEEAQIGSSSRMPANYGAALVLDRHSVPGKGTTSTVTIATCLAPVTFQELSRVGLGEVKRKEPQLQESRVQESVERVYAGRVIDSWREEPEGDALRFAVAELVLCGDLWPEAGRTLQQEVEAWNLYCRLGFGRGGEVEPHSWLTRRLAEIGLERAEDLQVLEPEDLDFPGVPSWERAEFDRLYPRRISLANLDLEVEYEPGFKRVTLVRRSGIRKTPPQRWELPAWVREWEIRFRDGNRIVPVG